MSFMDTITGAFSPAPTGSFMNSPANSQLSFTGNQPVTPQWQQNAVFPTPNQDAMLNQGMNAASANIGASDSFGGFGNADNTAYAGSNSWASRFGDVAEAIANNLRPQQEQLRSSSMVGGSGGVSSGSFRPVQMPSSPLPNMEQFTSQFTNFRV